MRDEQDKFVFVKTSGGATTFGHRVMQKGGAVLSEQLDGWGAFSRAKVPNSQPAGDGGGGAPATGGVDHRYDSLQGDGELPFDVQGATAGLVAGTGSAGIIKERIDVDIDDSDNVALMHTRGQVIDYDNIVTKPNYRPELFQSGKQSRLELKHSRRMAQRADASYDLDGDGMVSQKDYFFAVRFDKDGSGVLDPEEKAAAAHAMKHGFGSQFAFLRTSGPVDAHHRVMQRDGVILSEEAEGGHAALTAARAAGKVARIGGDGNIIDDSDGQHQHHDGSPAQQVHHVGLSEVGRVAMQHVQGAVVDYDTVITKPQFRPELVKSGATTKSELMNKRRKEKYPDLSMDLDGDGAVSQADYWFSKRYDVDDNNRLDEAEREKAKKDFDEGYQQRFITLSSSSAPGGAHRVVQLDNGAVHDGGLGMLTGGAEPYDPSVRLPVLGAVPGLDLPVDRMMRPAAGDSASGSLAGTYRSSVRRAAAGSTVTDGRAATKPVAVGSIGVVPGVARVLLRNPDGTQESYGGYAGGMGAAPLNNMTGTLSAVVGRPVGAGTEGAQVQQQEMDDTARFVRETIGKFENESSFNDRGNPAEVHKHAPWALAGRGGAEELHAADASLADTKRVSNEMGLLTRTQLIAARRLRARTAEDQNASTIAGVRSGGIMSEEDIKEMGFGESVLRSTLQRTSGPANLPQYMLQSMANRNQLPVLNDDLPHESIKPGAVPEGARSLEATTRTALAAARKCDQKAAALQLVGLPEDTVAMPQLYEAEFNDHHSHGHVHVSLGQADLSKTQTQLSKKRLAERVTESMQFAPPEPYGVHKGPLPSFSRKLNGSGLPWYADISHALGYTTNFMGSALDGRDVIQATADADAAFRSLPNFIEAVPPQYDPALRHTVRDTALHGTLHSSTASFGETTSGIGSKAPRLIKDGLLREDEEVHAADGDPFKIRTIHPHKRTLYIKKHGLSLPDNVSRTNPWETMKREAEEASPDKFTPQFDLSKPGARPRHVTHKNIGHPNNSLPGLQPLNKEAFEKSIKRGHTWSSSIVEYKQRMADGDSGNLDGTGKALLVDPKEYAPMYSSFTADHTFHSSFTKGNSSTRGPRPLKEDPPSRRNSLYGRAVAFPALDGSNSAGGSAPSIQIGGPTGAARAQSQSHLMSGYQYHDAVMTPGGSWNATAGMDSSRSNTSRGGTSRGHDSRADSHRAPRRSNSPTASDAGLVRKSPTRLAAAPLAPTPLVSTLQAAAEGGNTAMRSSGGAKSRPAKPICIANSGVRTGGFAV